MYCEKCGGRMAKTADFCPACGKPAKEKEPVTKAVDSPAPSASRPAVQPQPTVVKEKKSKAGWFWGCCIVVLIVGFITFSAVGLLALSLIGAKGQPNTLIQPVSPSEVAGATAEKSLKAPKSLKASPSDKDIMLTWNSTKGNIKNYEVYRSEVPNQSFSELTKVATGTNSYTDNSVTKGKTYYYFVIAASVAGVTSGNSNEAAAAVPAPPLLPNGVQSWANVLTKYEADKKYADLFDKITGFTKSDIQRYVEMEKSGKSMKTTLKAGTIITNTTEDYKILYGFKLDKDKEFLTDEFGNPHVMTWCGNPIKLIAPVTTTAMIYQGLQNVFINVIYIFPQPVINIFVDAGTVVNGIVIEVVPESIGVRWGPNFYPPPLINIFPEGVPGDVNTNANVNTNVNINANKNTPVENVNTPDENLNAGQKWAVEGKILVTANPHDPAEYEEVTVTVSLNPPQSGIAVNYSVEGTDDYYDVGTMQTDSNGEITFYVPGSYSGIHDTISVEIPELDLSGSVEYTF